MARILILFIRLYQFLISPWLGNCCRFSPSCSDYAKQALQQKNLFRALVLIGWRLLRCHPLSKGGIDELPKL